MRSPDYGLDAPGLVRGFLIVAAAAAALATGLVIFDLRLWAWVPGIVSAYATAMGVLMVVWSTRIKPRTREQLLDAIAWRGDEAVLDIGCGRGLMLVGAARRLNTGRATGIDIWQAADQSGNTAAAALDNAAYEGVADRVEVRTADMRALPFDDAAFDVVVSHWAVHNLSDGGDRDQALSEIARVLRSRGTLVLADIAYLDDYARTLAGLGWTAQERLAPPLRGAVLRMLSFGQFVPTALIARRPR